MSNASKESMKIILVAFNGLLKHIINKRAPDPSMSSSKSIDHTSKMDCNRSNSIQHSMRLSGLRLMHCLKVRQRDFDRHMPPGTD